MLKDIKVDRRVVMTDHKGSETTYLYCGRSKIAVGRKLNIAPIPPREFNFCRFIASVDISAGASQAAIFPYGEVTVIVKDPIDAGILRSRRFAVGDSKSATLREGSKIEGWVHLTWPHVRFNEIVAEIVRLCKHY